MWWCWPSWADFGSRAFTFESQELQFRNTTSYCCILWTQRDLFLLHGKVNDTQLLVIYKCIIISVFTLAARKIWHGTVCWLFQWAEAYQNRLIWPNHTGSVWHGKLNMIASLVMAWEYRYTNATANSKLASSPSSKWTILCCLTVKTAKAYPLKCTVYMYATIVWKKRL